MDREDLHKHFDYIIKNSDKVDSDGILSYISLMSSKVKIPFEDIIEEFIFYWRSKNDTKS